MYFHSEVSDMGNAYKPLIGEPPIKRKPGRSICRWDNNIDREVYCSGSALDSFRMCSVRISASTPAILTKIFVPFLSPSREILG
jgi:hypothetical protein